MSDNVTASVGTVDGPTFASDDIAGIQYPRSKVSLGADGSATDAVGGAGAVSAAVQRVTLASDDPGVTKLTSLVSPGLSAAVSVTRPSDTTGYGAFDVLGPTGGGTSGIDFNLGAISASNIKITGVMLERDVTALVSGEAGYRLHLYNVTPPSAVADNAVFNLVAGDRASYLGYIDISTPIDFGDTLIIDMQGLSKQVKLAGTHIFGYLVTTGGYTPASATVLRITLSAVQL